MGCFVVFLYKSIEESLCRIFADMYIQLFSIYFPGHKYVFPGSLVIKECYLIAFNLLTGFKPFAS